jgi:hypothetical protein
MSIDRISSNDGVSRNATDGADTSGEPTVQASHQAGRDSTVFVALTDARGNRSHVTFSPAGRGPVDVEIGADGAVTARNRGDRDPETAGGDATRRIARFWSDGKGATGVVAEGPGAAVYHVVNGSIIHHYGGDAASGTGPDLPEPPRRPGMTLGPQAQASQGAAGNARASDLTIDERIAAIKEPGDVRSALAPISIMDPEAERPAKLLAVATRLDELFRSNDPSFGEGDRIHAYGQLVSATHDALYLSRDANPDDFAAAYAAAVELSKYLPRDDSLQSAELGRLVLNPRLSPEQLAVTANAMLEALPGKSDKVRAGAFLLLAGMTFRVPKDQREPLLRTIKAHLELCPTSHIDGASARRAIADMEQ